MDYHFIIYRSNIFFSFRALLLLESALPTSGLSKFALVVGVIGADFLLLFTTGVEFTFDETSSSLVGDILPDAAVLDFNTSATLLLLSLIIFGPSLA